MKHRGSGTNTGTLDTGAQLLSVLDQLIRARVEEAVRSVRDEDEDPLIRSDRLGPNNRIVRRMIERGELVGVKIGNRWHVRRSEWERFTRELEARQRTDRSDGLAPANKGNGTADDPETGVDGVLAELGLERRPSPGYGARQQAGPAGGGNTRRALDRTPQTRGPI